MNCETIQEPASISNSHRVFITRVFLPVAKRLKMKVVFSGVTHLIITAADLAIGG